jgi:hypothetical protein
VSGAPLSDDQIEKAVALIFEHMESSCSDAFVGYLRNADMEAFRTALHIEHQRRLEEFYAKFGRDEEQAWEEFCAKRSLDPLVAGIEDRALVTEFNDEQFGHLPGWPRP